MAETFNDVYQPITEDALSKIPATMKAETRWVVWGGKKIPVNGNVRNQNGFYVGADATDPAAWMDYNTATALIGAACQVRGEYFHAVGIGFVVGDGWFCIDADGGHDHGREPVPERVISDLCKRSGTYAEMSISKNGCHLFGKCGFNTLERKEHFSESKTSYEIEFFTRRKFLIVTGDHVPGSAEDAIDCNDEAYDLYDDYVLTGCNAREEEEQNKREEYKSSITITPNDAQQFFLLNYPEILEHADVDHFKRGGKSGQLAPGEYSWIGAIKAMDEIGVPRSAIYDWCRRGASFAGEKDIDRVLDEKRSSSRKSSTASIVEDAKANGWKPDSEKLTGEYKEAYEAAASGLRTYDWDDIIDMGTGEISQAVSADTQPGTETVSGFVIHQAKPDAAKPASPDPAAPWDPIIKGNTLPSFPLDCFPGWIKDYIDNFSENTGINKDFCAACVLGAVSTVVCGHLDIHFNGTHYEPAQLYILFVGRSGSMKSTAVKQFHGPAKTWLMEKNKAVKESNQRTSAEIEELSEELSKAQRKKSGHDEEQISEIKARIETKRESKKCLYPVPFTDINPESTIKSMAETNGTATIAAPEGNLINVLTGRSSYNQRGTSPNLDIFLAGYDGEPYHGIRVTSGEVSISRADISILMAIQPTLLETLCRSSDANGRGLVQRFLIFAPENPETDIDHTRPNTTDQQHASRWNEYIRTIANRFMNPGSTPVIMELYNDADIVIRELWNYEAELIRKRGPADEEGITGWISKLHGKGLRLAAILSVLDEPQSTNITKKHAETAAMLLKDYFVPQYIGAYEAADNLTRGERKIISWIIRHAESTGDRESFMERDLKQHLRNNSYYTGRTGPERFRIAMEGLQDKNYIRPLITGSGRGRPSTTWQINPELFN